jgi:hypothetical protein
VSVAAKNLPMVMAIFWDRRQMLHAIVRRQREYARLFQNTPWRPDELSETGWLCLVAVPWLLKEVQQQGQQGNADGNPGADSIGLAQPPVQFMEAEQAAAFTATAVPAGNPLAKFFIVHLAKLVGVSFHVEQVRPAVKPVNQKGAKL